jgi:hypothetical protein
MESEGWLDSFTSPTLDASKWNSISRNSGDDSSHHGDNTEWYIFSLSWWIRRRLQYWFYATPSLTWTRWEYRNLLWLIFRTPKYHSIHDTFVRKQSRISRPWWPIGLWDVGAPTFSRQSGHRWRWGCQPYAPASGRFLVVISVRGWVDFRAIVPLEGLRQLKKPMTVQPSKWIILCVSERHTDVKFGIEDETSIFLRNILPAYHCSRCHKPKVRQYDRHELFGTRSRRACLTHLVFCGNEIYWNVLSMFQTWPHSKMQLDESTEQK